MVENHGRQSFISDMIEIKDYMQENDVPVLHSDKVKPDLELKCDEEEYDVPGPIKESYIVEAASNEENRVIDLSVLVPSEKSLHKEVIHSLNEKQDKIFVQVKEFLWMKLW